MLNIVAFGALALSILGAIVMTVWSRRLAHAADLAESEEASATSPENRAERAAIRRMAAVKLARDSRSAPLPAQRGRDTAPTHRRRAQTDRR